MPPVARSRARAVLTLHRSPFWRGRTAGVVLVVLALTLLAGCGLGETPAAPTAVPTPTPAPRPTAEAPAAVSGWYLAAQDEGALQVRADLTPGEIDELTRVFVRHYPKLTVQWTRGPDEQLLQTTLREGDARPSSWDVFIGHGAPSLKTARLADRWTPPEARTFPTDLVDLEGAWYAVAVTYHVLQYNSELVPPTIRPTTYEALRDARFFGGLAILDDDLTWLRGLVETRGRDATIQLLQPLVHMSVRPVVEAKTLSALVTSGQRVVAIDNLLDNVERDRRGGGKTGWVAVEPVITQPVAMVTSAATGRPNATRLFANFMLSPDAQQVLAASGRVPARPEVDPEPQTLVRGLRTRLTLPPQGAVEREIRAVWSEIWTRR